MKNRLFTLTAAAVLAVSLTACGSKAEEPAAADTKAEAAEEMSVASGMKYVMYAGSVLMKQNVLEHPPMTYSGEQSPLLMVAEDSVPYGK